MAYHDALFQLGMDLTRSSTAHEEDLDGTARVVHDDNDQQEDRKDFFIERDGVRYAGNHLIIDLFGAQRLDDIDLHHFTPNGGVSGVAVLSESHISIHSWPEADYAALDVFMCGDARPELCIDVLRQAFSAREVVVKTHQRGEELDLMAWRMAAKPEAADKAVEAGDEEAVKAA